HHGEAERRRKPFYAHHAVSPAALRGYCACFLTLTGRTPNIPSCGSRNAHTSAEFSCFPAEPLPAHRSSLVRSLTMADRSPDNAAMREYIYSLMAIPTARAILDIGCGDGYDLRRIGERASPDTRLVGLDRSRERVEAAAQEMGSDLRYSFAVADI